VLRNSTNKKDATQVRLQQTHHRLPKDPVLLPQQPVPAPQLTHPDNPVSSLTRTPPLDPLNLTTHDHHVYP